jgi:hypothetical protein
MPKRPVSAYPSSALGAALVALASPPTAAAQGGTGSPPAGGAEVEQIIIATAGALVLTGVLLFLGVGHRRRGNRVLARIGAYAERKTGLPDWAAVPAVLITVSLITALFGMLWDISLHIAEGRDAGPLANPAHYFILIGLFGVFASGFISMVLPQGRPSRSAVHIAGDWYAPLGGILITACGAFSLVGFPLDDVWHNLFGQDVTLWGPTHLMLIGGAAMTLVGLAVLLVEGRRANAEATGREEKRWIGQMRRIALPGAFLLGLSTFQAEFDFGVPQFRFVFHPMLVLFAAGAALVAARVWLGRWAALGAVAFFIVLRGVITLLVGPVLGEPTPLFPLYLVEAAIVELVAWRIPRTRPLALGAACGVLIGAVGLAAEWGWTHLVFSLPWPSTLLPEGALLGFGMAVAGSLIGAWIGARLAADEIRRTTSLRFAAISAAAATAAMVALALPKPAEPGATVTATVSDAIPGPNRAVNATLNVTPPGVAGDAEWLTVTSWQGGGLVVDRLRRLAPGTYATTEPIPVHANWKSMVRLHEGASIMSVPLFLPEDPAIPVAGVPADPRFTRAFVADRLVLQREQKTAALALWTAAYGAVLGITLGFLILLAWGVHRVAVSDAEPTPRRPKSEPASGAALRGGPAPASG